MVMGLPVGLIAELIDDEIAARILTRQTIDFLYGTVGAQMARRQQQFGAPGFQNELTLTVSYPLPFDKLPSFSYPPMGILPLTDETGSTDVKNKIDPFVYPFP